MDRKKLIVVVLAGQLLFGGCTGVPGSTTATTPPTPLVAPTATHARTTTTQSTTTTSRSLSGNIVANVSTLDDGISIVSMEPYPGCDASLNSYVLEPGYFHHIGDLLPNESVFIPYHDFTKPFMESFDVSATVPENLSLFCGAGRFYGYWDFGPELDG